MAPTSGGAGSTLTSGLSTEDTRWVRENYGVSTETRAAMLLPADADETEWLAARRTRIGASELSVVVPDIRNPHASPYSLYWRKVNGWDIEQSLAMRIGHELEPVVARLFGETRPDMALFRSGAALWGHPMIPWLCCTPDFLAVVPHDLGHRDDATGLMSGAVVPTLEPVECKTDEGGAGWGAPGTDQVPPHHKVQVYVQCAVFGSARGHLVRLAGKRLKAYVVEFDAAAQREFYRYVRHGMAFMQRVGDGNPPDIDAHKDTGNMLAQLYPKVEDRTEYVPRGVRTEYLMACAAYERATERRQLAVNALRLWMEDARFAAAPGGDPFAERRVYPRHGYTVPDGVVDGIWPKGKHNATDLDGGSQTDRAVRE